jgi:hypothetical protein
MRSATKVADNRSSANGIAVQLRIRLHKNPNAVVTRIFMDMVVRRWADDGYLPRGIEIDIMEWERGGRIGTPTDQAEARERFRGLLRAGRIAWDIRSFERT